MQSLKDLFQQLTNVGLFQRPLHCASAERKSSSSTEVVQQSSKESSPQAEYPEEEGIPPQYVQNPLKPPPFDGVMYKVKAISKKIEHIKGFRFEVQMAGSPNFNFSSSWNIPNSEKGKVQQSTMMSQAKPFAKATQPHYQLLLQYAGGSLQQLMQQKPTVVLVGKWDTMGRLEADIIKKWNDRVTFRLKSVFPYGSELTYSQVELACDVEGDNYNHTLKYGTGQFAVNMMQTIGRNLVLGFELMHVIQINSSFLSYAARYKHNVHTFYGQYIAAMPLCSLAYSLNLSRRASLISELNIDLREQKTNTVLGFQQRFQTWDVVATINSKGKISSALNLVGMSYALKLCAIADYLQDTYKFGYGMSIGQAGL